MKVFSMNQRRREFDDGGSGRVVDGVSARRAAVAVGCLVYTRIAAYSHLVAMSAGDLASDTRGIVAPGGDERTQQSGAPEGGVYIYASNFTRRSPATGVRILVLSRR